MAARGATMSKGTFQPDSDVHITFEDQQKINKFARLNAKLNDLKDELKLRENKMKNLEDACDEIALADDESGKIPYMTGEIFIYQDVETTQNCLDAAKESKQKEINELKVKCEETQDLMTELKSYLYGKFGSHINLEADEE